MINNRTDVYIAALLGLYRKMTDVAEEVVSGLYDHIGDIQSLNKERAENTKILRKIESQAVAGFRKITEEAHNFAADIRVTIDLFLSELTETIFDVSSTLKKNIFDVSKVNSTYNGFRLLLTYGKGSRERTNANSNIARYNRRIHQRHGSKKFRSFNKA